jgi:hypothetical protein
MGRDALAGLAFVWLLFWMFVWASIRLTQPLAYWESPWYDPAGWMAFGGAVVFQLLFSRSNKP